MNGKELQSTLTGLQEANNSVRKYRDAINEHAKEKYGHTPGSVNNKHFSCACDGEAGYSWGMTADEFDQSMVEYIGKVSHADEEVKTGGLIDRATYLIGLAFWTSVCCVLEWVDSDNQEEEKIKV